MPSWLRPVPRWSYYFRDALRCVYCQTSINQILADPTGDNFLTLDHVQSRSNGGDNGPDNVVTCCWRCNDAKGSLSLREFCAREGWNYQAVRSRVYRATRKPLEVARGQALVALGQVEGIPRATMVRDHDWLVRVQYAGPDERRLWTHLCHARQESLWCPTCGRPTDHRDDNPGPGISDTDPPF